MYVIANKLPSGNLIYYMYEETNGKAHVSIYLQDARTFYTKELAKAVLERLPLPMDFKVYKIYVDEVKE